ncbi:hypothetical protein PHSY_004873 [Pseudozyma hubeiensis SY62]|uniref:Uncharacterized protein n=1 Tax=Pseudozyma hubeiensis (strain SY62) TaxID=1305764 RepID=R9P7C4_PSEHS|nr:hypothetical protein PHSY_004873 [Pseudozyma hubeiensis SY62]GAC97288.1 hypothetical protein PHSY_004873 [Pseudozyma hubeiensis SY62]
MSHGSTPLQGGDKLHKTNTQDPGRVQVNAHFVGARALRLLCMEAKSSTEKSDHLTSVNTLTTNYSGWSSRVGVSESGSTTSADGFEHDVNHKLRCGRFSWDTALTEFGSDTLILCSVASLQQLILIRLSAVDSQGRPIFCCETLCCHPCSGCSFPLRKIILFCYKVCSEQQPLPLGAKEKTRSLSLLSSSTHPVLDHHRHYCFRTSLAYRPPYRSTSYSYTIELLRSSPRLQRLRQAVGQPRLQR